MSGWDLRKTRDWLSGLQAYLACAAVAFGGGVAPLSLTVFTVFALWGLLRRAPTEFSQKAQRYWTLGIFAALVGTLARALLRAEFLDAGVDFLLLLIVQRLFNRQRAREHMQLLLLGALLMVVGAVINTGLSYPVLLGIYLLTAITTLIVNHLMGEGERLGVRIAAEVDREARRSQRTLARSVLQVSVMAAVGALVVFVAFPRWGVGVFLRGKMARDAHSGFSREVRLGLFGRIKTDATVAARIVPLSPKPKSKRLTWHLRGSAFDRYEEGLWSYGRASEFSPLRQIGRFEALAPRRRPVIQTQNTGRFGRQGRYIPTEIPGFSASQDMLHALVTLEDLGVDVLFLASAPLAVKIDARGPIERRISVRGGRNREFRVTKPPGPVQYEFLARVGEPTPAELAAVDSPEVPPEFRDFLQRSSGLSAEVTTLAREIAGGSETRYAKVSAVMDYLEDFDYTTDLESSDRVEAGADPVEGFLFDTKAGHCEYFATAMAVLLREVGVPTRIVNGYYGAHYNELGEFYAVRQADAHSWVEVHFGPLGWVTFDPTPESGRIAGDDAPVWPAFEQAIDALRSAYLEYVIDYNLTKQLELLTELGVRGRGARPRVAWRPVLGWTLALVAVAWVVRRLRRRRRTRRSPEAVLYDRVLAKLESAGYPRRSHESPTRFAARLAREGAPQAAAFASFAELYEAVRFGPVPAAENLTELGRRAGAVMRRERPAGRRV